MKSNFSVNQWFLIMIIIIVIKKGRQSKAEREWYTLSDIHLISPKTQATQYQPCIQKEEKGKNSRRL